MNINDLKKNIIQIVNEIETKKYLETVLGYLIEAEKEENGKL